MTMNDNRITMNYPKLLQHLIFLTILLAASSCFLTERDHTLKPEEYRKLGMPDHKKVWTNDDYVSANITLSSLKINDPLSLPRKSSKKSGDLFKRMVNEENLSFIHDTILPLRTRAYTIQYFTRFQTEMEQMYTIEYNDRNYYSEELLDLHIFGLAVHDRMLELGWIINKSDDEDVEGIKSGMQAVTFNYLKLIPRLLGELVKTDIYSGEGLERLSKAISSSLQTNYEWMAPSDKSFLSSEFKNALGNSKSAEVKSNLQDCIDILDR